jgi:hypothetical protein
MYLQCTERREYGLSQYYYTVASLPLLQYDSENIFSIDNFHDICAGELTERDLALIKKISLVPAEKEDIPSSPTLDCYYMWERNLRNNLVRLRAHEKGVDEQLYLRPVEEIPGPLRVAQQAFQQESPLAAEQILNRARWELFDLLEAGHYFDIDYLIIYKLRLLLLWRKAAFKKEKGEASYNMIVQHFQQALVDLEHFHE